MEGPIEILFITTELQPQQYKLVIEDAKVNDLKFFFRQYQSANDRRRVTLKLLKLVWYGRVFQTKTTSNS